MGSGHILRVEPTVFDTRKDVEGVGVRRIRMTPRLLGSDWGMESQVLGVSSDSSTSCCVTPNHVLYLSELLFAHL